jgi:hypothetical protein
LLHLQHRVPDFGHGGRSDGEIHAYPHGSGHMAHLARNSRPNLNRKERKGRKESFN